MAKEKTIKKEKVREHVVIKAPGSWTVTMWNDDFTTMDFVVMVLEHVFLKPEAEATRIMLDVDRNGQCVVGRYSYDIATSRTQRAMQLARSAGFPLKVTCEED